MTPTPNSLPRAENSVRYVVFTSGQSHFSWPRILSSLQYSSNVCKVSVTKYENLTNSRRNRNPGTSFVWSALFQAFSQGCHIWQQYRVVATLMLLISLIIRFH